MLVAVIGEVVCDWKDMKGNRWKQFFGVLPIVGLAYELIEALSLDSEVSDAKTRAATANERASINELEVARLTKENLELKKRIQPRTIISEDRTNFVNLLKDIPKMPIKVVVGMEDNETVNFAEKVRAMLDEAGFGDNGEGVIRLGNNVIVMIRTGLDPQFSSFSLSLSYWGTTNDPPDILPRYLFQRKTNDFRWID